MQIKQQDLNAQLKRKIAPVYVLLGPDTYLMQLGLDAIKKAIKQTHDCDEKRLFISATNDWKMLAEESNSYSLFASTSLLNVTFEKKTLDAASKKILENTLAKLSSHCFIVLSAPNLPLKQASWLASHGEVVLVVAHPFNEEAMKQWISAQLKSHELQCQVEVPALIAKYAQGNMAAVAQTIEKLTLTHEKGAKISEQEALEHLSNQCEHTLYELIDALLKGQAELCIQILRQAANNKTEATLVLWMLTQEVRLLAQLEVLVQQKVDVKTACSQLKLWPSRVFLYQARLKQAEQGLFAMLLVVARQIDEQIKSNLSAHSWHSLERLCLSICQGRLIGDPCNA